MANNEYVVGCDIDFQYSHPRSHHSPRNKRHPPHANDHKKSTPTSNAKLNSDVSVQYSSLHRKWFASSAKERQQIKKFWDNLTEVEKFELTKVDKELILSHIKKQVPDCECDMCAKRVSAVVRDVDELYNKNKEYLQEYTKMLFDNDRPVREENSPTGASESPTTSGKSNSDLLNQPANQVSMDVDPQSQDFQLNENQSLSPEEIDEKLSKMQPVKEISRKDSPLNPNEREKLKLQNQAIAALIASEAHNMQTKVANIRKASTNFKPNNVNANATNARQGDSDAEDDSDSSSSGPQPETWGETPLMDFIRKLAPSLDNTENPANFFNNEDYKRFCGDPDAKLDYSIVKELFESLNAFVEMKPDGMSYSSYERNFMQMMVRLDASQREPSFNSVLQNGGIESIAADLARFKGKGFLERFDKSVMETNWTPPPPLPPHKQRRDGQPPDIEIVITGENEEVPETEFGKTADVTADEVAVESAVEATDDVAEESAHGTAEEVAEEFVHGTPKGTPEEQSAQETATTGDPEHVDEPREETAISAMQSLPNPPFLATNQHSSIHIINKDDSHVNHLEGSDKYLTFEPETIKRLQTEAAERQQVTETYLRQFTALIFEQRVLRVYHEHIAKERQEQLLKEIAESEARAQADAARKLREKEKKRAKKQAAKLLREEKERQLALEAEKKAESIRQREESMRARQLENDRKKEEERRRKIEERMEQLRLQEEKGRASKEEEEREKRAQEVKRAQEDRKKEDERKKEEDKKAAESKKKAAAEEKKSQDKKVQDKKAADEKRNTDKKAADKQSGARRIEREKDAEMAKLKERLAELEKANTGGTIKEDSELSSNSSDVQVPPRVSTPQTSQPQAVPNSEKQKKKRERKDRKKKPEPIKPLASTFSPPFASPNIRSFQPSNPTQLPQSMNMPFSNSYSSPISEGPKHLMNFNSFNRSPFNPNVQPSPFQPQAGPNVTNPAAAPFAPGIQNMWSSTVPPTSAQKSAAANIDWSQTPLEPPSAGSQLNTRTQLGLGRPPTPSSSIQSMPLNQHSHTHGHGHGHGLTSPLSPLQNSIGLSLSAQNISGQFSSGFPVSQTYNTASPAFKSQTPVQNPVQAQVQVPGSVTASVQARQGSPWSTIPTSSSLSPPPTLKDIGRAAQSAYKEAVKNGVDVDGFVPSQVLYHSSSKLTAGRFNQSEFHRACATLPQFDSIRDDVGLITHIKL